MTKNTFGRKLKKILSENGWEVIHQNSFGEKNVSLDSLSYLVGACYQIVKDEQEKTNKAKNK